MVSGGVFNMIRGQAMTYIYIHVYNIFIERERYSRTSVPNIVHHLGNLHIGHIFSLGGFLKQIQVYDGVLLILLIFTYCR